jgi:uroporphyrinogen-III synthase
VLVASIGPTTSAALRELQAPPQLESAQPGIEALADSLAAQLIGAKR